MWLANTYHLRLSIRKPALSSCFSQHWVAISSIFISQFSVSWKLDTAEPRLQQFPPALLVPNQVHKVHMIVLSSWSVPVMEQIYIFQTLGQTKLGIKIPFRRHAVCSCITKARLPQLLATTFPTLSLLKYKIKDKFVYCLFYIPPHWHLVIHTWQSKARV